VGEERANQVQVLGDQQRADVRGLRVLTRAKREEALRRDAEVAPRSVEER